VKDLQCFAAGTTGKALVLALVLGLPVACSTRKQPVTHHIVVADISGRIEPASRHEMLEGIAAFAVTLRRGDKLTVIPITGDAEADSQGRILQFAVPTRREPYDEDLRRFGAQVRERMVQLTSEAERAPGDHTDILGTLDIVADEIRSSPAGESLDVTFLSDFIQDGCGFDFNTDPRLGSQGRAEALAHQECQQHVARPTAVNLGLLRSRDLARLSNQRRRNIQRFWKSCMEARGLTPELHIDGMSLLRGR
jgi:hypothetical protein